MLTRSRFFLLLFIAIVVIGGASFLYNRQRIHQSKRHAVVLTSGRVYYGFIGSTFGQFYTLNDVYYQRSIETSTENGTPRISLTKLSDDPSAPQGPLFINRDHVLSFTAISDTSRINEAIQRYEQEKQNAASPSPSPAP